jgi:hypothetical protein
MVESPQISANRQPSNRALSLRLETQITGYVTIELLRVNRGLAHLGASYSKQKKVIDLGSGLSVDLKITPQLT